MPFPVKKRLNSLRVSLGLLPRFVLVAAMLLALSPVQPASHAQAAQPGGASSAASSGTQKDTSDAQQGPSPIAVPLPKGKKLVMNDGTFQIVREYTLSPFLVSINCERDALIKKRLVGFVFATLQLIPPEVQEQVVQRAVLFSRMVDGTEHLVISAVQFVPL